MNITLFQDVTTDEVLNQLQAESEEYEGLYVDMDNAPERKYVKEKAELINKLLKSLNRARIDKSADYKAQVEREAQIIKERLELANKPFSLLLDEHKAKRAKILADEKAAKQKIIDDAKFEADHEFALLLNKTYEFDQAEKVRLQVEHEKHIAELAAAEAVEQHKRFEEQRKQQVINEENARLANVEHVRGINQSILAEMLKFDLDQEKCINFIKHVARKNVTQLTINY